MNDITVKEVLTDAIHYWEWRRIIYNGILTAVVVVVFFFEWPRSMVRLSFDLVQHVFVLAVLANVFYCAAYPVDVAAQVSGVRNTWLRVRWVLFVIGLMFACILARFFSLGLFVGRT